MCDASSSFYANNYAYNPYTPLTYFLEPSIITIILLIIVTQQRRILPPSQVLLQPAFALRVHIPPASKQAQQNGKQDERVRGRPQHEGDPDAEIVDFEDLRRC